MIKDDASSIAPLVFENAGKVFRPDACEPLKDAATRGEIDLCGWARGNYPGRRIPKTVLPGIRSIGIWDAGAKQAWGLGEHCNEGLEISFLSRGSLSFSSSGKKTILQPFDVTITPPWKPHQVGLPTVEASRLAWIILDLEVRRPNQEWTWPDWIILSSAEKEMLADEIQNSDRSAWPAQFLKPMFDSISDLLSTGDPDANETDAKIQINSLILYLARNIGRHGKPIPMRNQSLETARLFLERLHDHIEYPWRVEQMAEQCGVSRGTFISSCRTLLNRTPHAYLMQLRMKRARQLLAQNSKASLTEIAMGCGFSSSAHFSTSFRKEYGQTPSAYRQRRSAGSITAE